MNFITDKISYTNLIVIIASIICTFLFSCKTGSLDNNQNSQVTNNFTKPEIKWLYISQPLEFEESKLNGNCKILIFYNNNELGRVDCRTTIFNDKKIVEIPDREITAIGNWELSSKDQIKAEFQICKCTHCREFNVIDEKSHEELQNPMPVLEAWEISKGKIGKADSEIIRKGIKYKNLEQNNYQINDFEDLIENPTRLKSKIPDIFRCYKEDLEYF